MDPSYSLRKFLNPSTNRVFTLKQLICILMMCTCSSLRGQVNFITGTISLDFEPVVGATVQNLANLKKTSSDKEGHFRL